LSRSFHQRLTPKKGEYRVRIIGVLDLAGGRAVHARAGMRDTYAPVRQVGGATIDGDATVLAGTYVEQLGITELYVADLDAITKGVQVHEIVHALASPGVPLWLDAGVSSVQRARDAAAAGATFVIVALETLPSFSALDDICAAVGGSRVAFSLDLRDARPITSLGGTSTETHADRHRSVEDIARRAGDSGIGALVVIDLARVGMGGGPDLETIGRVRSAAPDLILIAGGGVRGREDLARLADAGCDGALLATALQDGRLTARDVRGARALHRSVSR
jgi:phosphoribosylformimino-5-aminoimidazole carboxamide ribotide isomerase